MQFENLNENWEKFGKKKPLWSILSYDESRKDQWDIDEFFARGVEEIEEVTTYCQKLSLDFPRHKALDFGCGVGRLTQALMRHFDEVVGVDIASAMIDLANQYNKHGDKCRYAVNQQDDLRIFENDTFDFIYSNIVLQHMKPMYSKKFILEFIRVLKPNGVLIFQLPHKRILDLNHPSFWVRTKNCIRMLTPRFVLNIKNWIILKIFRNPVMEMYAIRKEFLMEFLNSYGLSVVDVVEDRQAGRNWQSFRYCALKRGEK